MEKDYKPVGGFNWNFALERPVLEERNHQSLLIACARTPVLCNQAGWASLWDPNCGKSPPSDRPLCFQWIERAMNTSHCGTGIPFTLQQWRPTWRSCSRSMRCVPFWENVANRRRGQRLLACRRAYHLHLHLLQHSRSSRLPLRLWCLHHALRLRHRHRLQRQRPCMAASRQAYSSRHHQLSSGP